MQEGRAHRLGVHGGGPGEAAAVERPLHDGRVAEAAVPLGDAAGRAQPDGDGLAVVERVAARPLEGVPERVAEAQETPLALLEGIPGDDVQLDAGGLLDEPRGVVAAGPGE